MNKFVYLCPIISAKQITNERDDFYYLTSTSITTDYNRIIKVDMVDVYENLALKRLSGLQQLLYSIPFDYVCCVDDDTYINFNNINRMNCDKNSNYGVLLSTTSNSNLRQERNSHKKPYTTVENVIFPAGGGYILSRKSLMAIDFSSLITEVQQNIDNNIDMSYEDVIIGVALKRAKQPLIHNGFWIQKSSQCFSSCHNTFFHSTKIITPTVLKSLSLMY